MSFLLTHHRTSREPIIAQLATNGSLQSPYHFQVISYDNDSVGLDIPTDILYWTHPGKLDTQKERQVLTEFFKDTLEDTAVSPWIGHLERENSTNRNFYWTPWRTL